MKKGSNDRVASAPVRDSPSAHDSVLAVLNAFGCGGLILDQKGRVLQTNEKARRYLGHQLRIRTRSDFDIEGTSTNDAMLEALRAALRTATEVSPQLGYIITVPRATSRPLLLRTIRFRADAKQESATAALIVLDMEDCPRPDERILRELFLLTPAEARLATGLSCGDNLHTISKELGVGIGTLRVQLKRIFWKTGTRRQGELIALLSRLALLHVE